MTKLWSAKSEGERMFIKGDTVEVTKDYPACFSHPKLHKGQIGIVTYANYTIASPYVTITVGHRLHFYPASIFRYVSPEFTVKGMRVAKEVL